MQLSVFVFHPLNNPVTLICFCFKAKPGKLTSVAVASDSSSSCSQLNASLLLNKGGHHLGIHGLTTEEHLPKNKVLTGTARYLECIPWDGMFITFQIEMLQIKLTQFPTTLFKLSPWQMWCYFSNLLPTKLCHEIPPHLSWLCMSMTQRYGRPHSRIYCIKVDMLFFFYWFGQILTGLDVFVLFCAHQLMILNAKAKHQSSLLRRVKSTSVS